MKEAHREPLFYYNKCKYTTFFERKARITKNNVSLQLLVPNSAIYSIYSQIHII